jgi:hypothetical protein
MMGTVASSLLFTITIVIVDDGADRWDAQISVAYCHLCFSRDSPLFMHGRGGIQKFSNCKYCYVDDREWAGNGSRFKLCTDTSGVGNTKQQPTAQVPFHVVNHDSLTDIEQQTNSQATNENRPSRQCGSMVPAAAVRCVRVVGLMGDVWWCFAWCATSFDVCLT